MRTPGNIGDVASRLTTEVRAARELGHETTPVIDDLFLTLGRQALGRSEGSFFNLIDSSLLTGDLRPESVDHHRTILQPNAVTSEEVEKTLGLVDLMLGPQAGVLTEQFKNYAETNEIFARMQAGEKFLVVSNHLELPDQGFTLGLWQKAARDEGLDRLEHQLTVIIGRLIGYYQLGDTNVMDGILRKAGSVLKTFPVSGTEKLDEASTEAIAKLRLFRKICNERSKDALRDLMTSPEGRMVCMAGSGTQDRFDPTDGAVHMEPFGSGTCEMIIDSSTHGATVIPLFADYAPDHSIVRILPPIQPKSLVTRADCDEIGRQIAGEGSHARGAAYAEHPDIERFFHPIIYNER